MRERAVGATCPIEESVGLDRHAPLRAVGVLGMRRARRSTSASPRREPPETRIHIDSSELDGVGILISFQTAPRLPLGLSRHLGPEHLSRPLRLQPFRT